MGNRSGFTLLEVVLAIGLSGAVLGLLATAIDLYLVRVDASRTQVETAQLARTLLNQIADDVCAARYVPASAPSDESTEGSGDESTADEPIQSVRGIAGTAQEIRIDRSAAWNWEQQARSPEVSEVDPGAIDTMPEPSNMPQTIRYLLGEGKELLAAKLAAAGVGEERLPIGYAGLYRERLSTVAWIERNTTAIGSGLAPGNTADAELIAPEVVDIAFAYYDGQQLLNEWDSAAEQGLPTAVEIRLTLLKEPFEQAAVRSPDSRDELRRDPNNLVEYRRFIRLTDLAVPHDAEFPQPSSGSSAQQSQ